MMDIVQIITLSIIASLLFIILKDVNPAFAFFIVIITSTIILFSIVNQISMIIHLIRSLSEKASVDKVYMDTILKIIGIAYITELGANMTKDAGLSSVSGKIELAGKMFILLLAIPIISAVIEVVLNFIPTTTMK